LGVKTLAEAIYSIAVRWHGPFENLADADCWAQYGAEEPFQEGLYLAIGWQWRIWWALPRHLRPVAYIGESTRIRNRLRDDLREGRLLNADKLWLGEIISRRVPADAAQIPSDVSKETDRWCLEQTLIRIVGPCRSGERRHQFSERVIVTSLWNVLDVPRGIRFLPGRVPDYAVFMGTGNRSRLLWWERLRGRRATREPIIGSR